MTGRMRKRHKKNAFFVLFVPLCGYDQNSSRKRGQPLTGSTHIIVHFCRFLTGGIANRDPGL
jgi:hypothetical protein